MTINHFEENNVSRFCLIIHIWELQKETKSTARILPKHKMDKTGVVHIVSLSSDHVRVCCMIYMCVLICKQGMKVYYMQFLNI
jgi:hypothetical protein